MMFSRNRRFHLRMTYACVILAVVSVVGCVLTSVHTDLGSRALALLCLVAIVSPLPAYWHEKGRSTLRDSTLVIPWIVSVAILLPFPTLIAARLNMPLQDSLLSRIDDAFGVSVPSIRLLASHHWVGLMLNRSYTWLFWLLLTAVFAPTLLGKLSHAREFVVANLIAFAVGTPLFGLLPAVGPWYGHHFAPTADQLASQLHLLAVRLPGRFVFDRQQLDIICFPSFHVIWAVLSARSLWGFRPLRIPIAVLSVMIILSTMTTGWHYFSDVLAGLAVATSAIVVAKWAASSSVIVTRPINHNPAFVVVVHQAQAPGVHLQREIRIEMFFKMKSKLCHLGRNGAWSAWLPLKAVKAAPVVAMPETPKAEVTSQAISFDRDATGDCSGGRGPGSAALEAYASGRNLSESSDLSDGVEGKTQAEISAKRDVRCSDDRILSRHIPASLGTSCADSPRKSESIPNVDPHTLGTVALPFWAASFLTPHAITVNYRRFSRRTAWNERFSASPNSTSVREMTMLSKLSDVRHETLDIYFAMGSATESPPPSSSKKSLSIRFTMYVLSVETPTPYSNISSAT